MKALELPDDDILTLPETSIHSPLPTQLKDCKKLVSLRVSKSKFFLRQFLTFSRWHSRFFETMFNSMGHSVAAKNQIHTRHKTDLVDQLPKLHPLRIS